MSNVNQLAARVTVAAGSTPYPGLASDWHTTPAPGYRQSIRTVNMAYLHWENVDALGDDVSGTVFEAFMRAKEAHRITFGSLRRVQGEWV